MARQLCAKCYQMCDKGQLAKDFDTRSQFRSAALSEMNNIEEGFGRYSTNEFVRFLDYSAGSCTEVKSMTYVMMDIGYFDQDFIIELQKDSEGFDTCFN